MRVFVGDVHADRKLLYTVLPRSMHCKHILWMAFKHICSFHLQANEHQFHIKDVNTSASDRSQQYIETNSITCNYMDASEQFSKGRSKNVTEGVNFKV